MGLIEVFISTITLLFKPSWISSREDVSSKNLNGTIWDNRVEKLINI